MIELLCFLLIVLAFHFIGYSFLRVMGYEQVVVSSGLPFLFGSLFYTYLILFLMSVAHFEFSFALVMASILILLFFCFFFGRVKKIHYRSEHQKVFSQLKREFKQEKKLFKLVGIILLILVGSSFLLNFMWPITDWDAITLYDFRAHLLSTTGSFPNDSYLLSYPPFTSLLHAISYTVGFLPAKVWYSVLYLHFILAFFFFLKKKINPKYAAVATLVLSIVQQIFTHSLMAYTNLPYLIFLCLGIFLSWEAIRTKSIKDLALSVILLSASSWVRSSEPFWMIEIFFLLWFFVNNPKKYLSIVLLFLLGIKLSGIWPHFLQNYTGGYVFNIEKTANPSNSVGVAQGLFQALLPLFHFNTQYLMHIRDSISYFIRYVINPIWFWWLISLLSLKSVKWNRNFLLELFTILILAGVTFIGILQFSFTVSFWQAIGGSVTRMTLFFIPLLIFITFENLFDEK